MFFFSPLGQTNLSAKFDVIRVDLQASEQFKSVSSFSLSSKLLTLPTTPWGLFPEREKKKRMGLWGVLSRTSTVFRNKICDFLFCIYDLTRNSIPHLIPTF